MEKLAGIKHVLWGAWWRKTLVIVVVLVGLYAALGFLAVPAVLQWQLPKQVAKYTTGQASVGEAAFNPFSFRLRLSNFVLKTKAHQPLLQLGKLDVNFNPLRLVNGELNFAWIRLTAPRVNAAVNRAGQLNFATLLRPQSKPHKASTSHGKMPTVAIAQLTVTDGHIAYSDRSQSRDFHTTLNTVNFHLKDFSTRPNADGSYQFTASLGAGQSLAWRGSLGVNPLSSVGQINIQGLQLTTLWPYLAHRFAFRLASGKLGLQVHYAAHLEAGKLQLTATQGAAELADFMLVNNADAVPLINVPSLDVQGVSFNLAKRKVTVDTVTTQGGRIHAQLDRQHQVDLIQLLKPIPDAAPTAPAKATPAAAQKATPPFTIAVGAVTVQHYGIAFTDASGLTPVQFKLEPIDLSVTGYTSANDQPIKVSADVGLDGGTLHVAGPVKLAPLDAQLDLSLKHLDLVPFQPYLARFARVRLRGGALSVHGTVSYRAGAQAPDLRFTGGMKLDQLAVDSSVSHAPLLQLGTLAVDGLQYLGPSASLSIRKVLIDAPFAHIVVNPDHTTNLGNLVVSQPAGTHHGKRPPHPGTRPLSVNVGEIAVKGGHLGFADQSMQPQVQVGIENLRGNVTHFSTQPGHSASVDFEGDVGPYAPVTIKGTINPLAKALTADIGVQFRNLGLTAFSAYSGKFAGYRIKKGKANLTLDYAIHDGLMQGKNTVVLNQLELGEKVDSPDAVHLPLKLAIALLKNSDGVIDLDLPVHGDLNDPQFAIGPLIWKVVVNVLTKAVTSPFHLLASLVGLHGGNLGQLAFTPGQATLGTTDQKDLSALASAMQKRPNLTLDIAGTTAAPADRDALAQARLLARLQGSQATPAASTATAPPALTPDEQAGLLKAYRKAFDSDAQDAVKRTPSESRDSYRARVTRFALAKLVAREPITPAALQQLAQARAEAVRTYLVQHGGLDAERIFMVEPTVAGAIAHGKVQMPLKLQVE